MARRFVAGSRCWFPDPERAFSEGTVKEIAKGTAVIEKFDGTIVQCNEDGLLPRARDQVIAEMDLLLELHEASVLNNVELLFGQPVSKRPGEGFNTIYSGVGPVLIAMNPFKDLPIYSKEWVDAYHDAGGNEGRNKVLGPHCYRTVQEAYTNLWRRNYQSVVICGESGAGKTVTNRYMIEYLLEVAAPAGKKGGVDVQAISEANTLLECFGNAKTTRNHNSSRFGKYTKLQFGGDGFKVAGCSVEHYLLERSRVVFHSPAERNYHIFYELLTSDKCKAYDLEMNQTELYKLTAESVTVKEIDDAKDFQALWGGMSKAGFSDEMRDSIMVCVASVMHLGNVTFTGDRDKAQVDPASKKFFDSAVKFLQIDPADFDKALRHNLIKPPKGAEIWKELGIDECNAQRDTIAKTLYSRMFDRIVSFLSSTLSKSRGSLVKGQQEGIIGLLDIFGFEDMAINGFEQMFINLTNERIQHLFNKIIFERELEVYKAEGILAAFNPGQGNLDTVKMFTSTPGIVKLLAEGAFMKEGRDNEAFVSALNQSFASHKSGAFKVCDPADAQGVARAKGLKSSGGKGSSALDYRRCFQIVHYAGTILYTVDNWVPKNNDSLQNHISSVMVASKSEFISELFETEEEKARATVGEKFISQLEVLGNALEQGETLFVRCIKSNMNLVPNLVDRKLVMEQLVNGGVIAALEMREKGLPDRIEYGEFIADFGGLTPPNDMKKDDKKRAEAILLDLCGPSAKENTEYAMGNTKVFMKSHVCSLVRSAGYLRMRQICKLVQARVRIFLGTVGMRKVQSAMQVLQEAETRAKAHEVDQVPAIKKQLAESRGIIEPMYKMVDDLMKEYGNDFEKISKSLPQSKTNEMYPAAREATQIVDYYLNGKKELDEMLARRVVQAINECYELSVSEKDAFDRTSELEDRLGKTEWQSMRDAHAKASQMLEKLQNEDFPKMRDDGIDPKVAEREDLSDDNCAPEIDDKMTEVKALVQQVIDLHNDFEKYRVNFKEDVAYVLPLYEATHATLEDTSAEAKRFVTEGMTEVADAVRTAWIMDGNCQDEFELGLDPPKYISLVEAFAECVKDAQVIFDNAKEELRRREAEKAERVELQNMLDQLSNDVAAVRQENEIAKDLGFVEAKAYRAKFEELTAEIYGLGYNKGDVTEWRAMVDDVKSRVVDTSEECRQAMAISTQQRKANFKNKFEVFNSKPEEKQVGGVLTAAEYLKHEGIEHHEDQMVIVSGIIKSMQEKGYTKKQIVGVMTGFLNDIYGDTGMGGFHMSNSKHG